MAAGKRRLRRVVALIVLGACDNDPCAYTSRVDELSLTSVSLSMERDCGDATTCDLLVSDVGVSLYVYDASCLRSSASLDAQINGKAARVSGGGGERFQSGGHTLGSFGGGPERCECNGLTANVEALERKVNDEMAFELRGSSATLGASWAAPEDFFLLEFPDGNPVPEGGRVNAVVPTQYDSKLELTVEFVLDDGSDVPTPLPASVVDAQGRQTFEFGMLKSARVLPGRYAAAARWRRRSSECKVTESATCDLTISLISHFEVVVDAL